LAQKGYKLLHSQINELLTLTEAWLDKIIGFHSDIGEYICNGSIVPLVYADY